MRRFSIHSLMAFVFVSAIGLAALRNANEVWAGVLLAIVFITLATSVVGAITVRGGEQYAWAGFAVFGGGYLAMTLGPGLDAPFKVHFGTSALLGYVQSQVAFASPSQSGGVPNQITRRANLVKRIAALEEATDGTNLPTLATLKKRVAEFDAATERERILLAAADKWRSVLPGAANAEQFFCVGHSLFALFVGMVGAVIARIFYARRERSEVPRHES